MAPRLAGMADSFRSEKEEEEEEEDDEDEDDEEAQHMGDRIRRNYPPHPSSYQAPTNIPQASKQMHNLQHHQQQIEVGYSAASTTTTATNTFREQQPTGSGQATIHVHLDEGYFAKERRALVGGLATVRSKWSQMQMFNPARNNSTKAEEATWNEKEKYTLDSLNEAKAPQESFQWSRPEDGRRVWSSKVQYFLAITSYSIGLGNVIRFPILVQKNGGLAFIIPFVIMLALEGVPLFYLELAIGQRMRRGAISCWNLVSPLAAGIGIASAAVSFIIGLYYNTMVAWTLLYLLQSLGALTTTTATSGDVGPQAGRSLFGECPIEQSKSAPNNHLANNISAHNECKLAGPFAYHWFRDTLDASPEVSNWAPFNWSLAGSFLVAWLISYLCLAKGLSNFKQLVYVASLLPYVILCLFLAKALALEGASAGLAYLFQPDWTKIVEPYTWLQASAQVFFSLGLGFGGLIALSSYNQVNNNCYRDAVRVSLVNFGTSLLAGALLFSLLGHKAHISNEQCLGRRAQAIDFYLADYTLKAIDYGAPFTPSSAATTSTTSTTGSTDSKATLNLGLQDANPEDDYYDIGDALASIRSLDRELDGVTAAATNQNGLWQARDPKAFDYGDGDVEIIVDASDLISANQLDQIVSQIPDLPQCSIRQELDQAGQGSALVFVVVAEALSQLKGSTANHWALAFFVMLLTLGLDSQFGNLEGLLSSLVDFYPLSSTKTNDVLADTLPSSPTSEEFGALEADRKRRYLTAIICSLSLLISLIMFAHGAGSYLFAIFDEYAASFSLVLIALFELLTISYIFGLKRFCDDCELMTGKRPPFLVLLSWRYVSPIILIVVIIATIRELGTNLDYEAWIANEGRLETKVWPGWCVALGVLLVLACVVWIPLVAFLSKLNIQLVPKESLSQCWFPAEELKEFHEIQEEHDVTKLERVLFGFKSDDD